MTITKLNKLLYRTSVVAEFLGVCRKTVYEMIDRDELDACWVLDTPRSLRVSVRSVANYYNRISPTESKPPIIMAGPLIQPRTAGWMMDITRRSVYRLINNHKIPAVKVAGGFRLHYHSVEKYVEQKLIEYCDYEGKLGTDVLYSSLDARYSA